MKKIIYTYITFLLSKIENIQYFLLYYYKYVGKTKIEDSYVINSGLLYSSFSSLCASIYQGYFIFQSMCFYLSRLFYFPVYVLLSIKVSLFFCLCASIYGLVSFSLFAFLYQL